MSNELDKQLADLIGAAKTAGQDAFAFIQQQAPDVCEQIVRWKLTEGVLGAIAGAAVLGVGLYGVWRGCKFGKDSDWTGVIEIILLMFGTAAAAGGAITLGVNTTKAAKAYVAPKVVLLETIAGVVKR